MFKPHLLISVLILLIFSLNPVYALSNGGCTSTCEYPFDYPLFYFSTTQAASAVEAQRVCGEMRSLIAPGWNFFGYIIHWLGGDPPTASEKKRFSCYACVDAVIPDPFEETLAPDDDLSLGTATAIATGVYGGDVTEAQRFFTSESETSRSGASYFLTLSGVAEFEGSAGMVEVDPFTGQMIRHHPVNCEER